MKRVAIFGNAGGGKSTLARELSSISGLPLYVVDKLQCGPGGSELPHAVYLESHEKLVEGAEWIIDGYGCVKSAWQRFEAADTLIHVDLPLLVHFIWVTKRLVKGFFATPEGWPEGSPVVRSSIGSYRVLLPCHRKLTPKYRTYISEVADLKKVYHLRSKRDIRQFLAKLKLDFP